MMTRVDHLLFSPEQQSLGHENPNIVEDNGHFETFDSQDSWQYACQGNPHWHLSHSSHTIQV